ncbi:MAG: serine/threonine protein kinase [Deltaproteobacteria bacterium]|nr:serine/threonine protein kinase [Deltaproteobacteria bacterium]
MSRALGRYELLRPLARGGMAEVYLARRKSAGVEKWLVVKRIRAERATDVRFLDLFVREARLSMSLAHQNIVPVFDFGRIDDQVFLAMERIEGKDLGSTIARAATKLLSPMAAAFIAAECCQALDYAHRRKSPEGAALGIVHRDVTPRNILLSWSGEVKLTDFGIAALAGDAASNVTGTPAYMAPEQAKGETVDARADVYGVGLVLRELLTGQRARPGEEREATLAAARDGTLVPWSAGIDPALVAIVDRATATSPHDRFPDASAMLAELDTFIVAERAAHKAEAPARQLATWLDAVWGTERDDEGDGGEVEGNHLVSFLDDGGLGVIGTGTERSMLATAAEEAPVPAPRVEVPAPPQPPPIPMSAMIRGAVLMCVLATAGGFGLTWLMSRANSSAELVSDAAPIAIVTPPIDAGAVPMAIDAAVDALADAPIDAAPSSPPDAGPRVRPAKIDASVAPDAAAGSAAVTPPPVVLRRVTINATPWAYFTVDSDPTQYQTIKTIQLAPGQHVIHFSNPVLKVERDVTIDVPVDRDTSHVERLGN